VPTYLSKNTNQNTELTQNCKLYSATWVQELLSQAAIYLERLVHNMDKVFPHVCFPTGGKILSDWIQLPNETICA